MDKPVKRIITAAISLLITCALLLGGYSFYNNYIVQRPLLQALNDIAGVKEVQLVQVNDKYQITVALDQAGNLQNVYVKLDETAAFYLANKEFELKVTDNRNSQLTDIYNQLQPYIYEALAKDNYIWLNEEIGRQITENCPDAKYEFNIDADRIYLQFNQEQKNLYAIIPRELSDEAVQL